MSSTDGKVWRVVIYMAGGTAVALTYNGEATAQREFEKLCQAPNESWIELTDHFGEHLRIWKAAAGGFSLIDVGRDGEANAHCQVAAQMAGQKVFAKVQSGIVPAGGLVVPPGGLRN